MGTANAILAAQRDPQFDTTNEGGISRFTQHNQTHSITAIFLRFLSNRNCRNVNWIYHKYFAKICFGPDSQCVDSLPTGMGQRSSTLSARHWMRLASIMK